MFKAPRAGDLKTRIQLYVPNPTADAMGGISQSWIQSGAFWGMVEPLRPTRTQQASTEHYAQELVVTARYEAPGRVSDRLVIKGDPYIIFAIKDPDQNGAYKCFYCTSTNLESA